MFLWCKLVIKACDYFWSKNYGTYVLEIFNNFGSLHYVWKCDLWRFNLLWKSTLHFYVNAKLLLRYTCDINNYFHVVHWFHWHIFSSSTNCGLCFLAVDLLLPIKPPGVVLYVFHRWLSSMSNGALIEEVYFDHTPKLDFILSETQRALACHSKFWKS